VLLKRTSTPKGSKDTKEKRRAFSDSPPGLARYNGSSSTEIRFSFVPFVVLAALLAAHHG